MKWDNVFPNVPDSFSERIQKTLDSQSVSKNERVIFMKKRAFIIAIIATLSLSVITAGATVLNNLWNPKLAEIFEADETIQEQLSMEGVASVVNKSVTDNGVTMEVVQTLGDKRYNYILLRFTSENEALFKAESFGNLVKDHLKIEGYDREYTAEDRLAGADTEEVANSSWSAGFVDDSKEIITGENGQINYQRYYYFCILNDNQQNYNGKKFTVSFEDLIAYEGKLEGEYTVINGEWEISWVMEYQDSTQVFELNKKIKVNGYEAVVETVELSPISINFTISGKDIGKINELETSISPSLILLDGTVKRPSGGGGSEKWDGDNRSIFTYSQGFRSVFDVQKVKGISLFFPNRGFADDTVEILFD